MNPTSSRAGSYPAVQAIGLSGPASPMAKVNQILLSSADPTRCEHATQVFLYCQCAKFADARCPQRAGCQASSPSMRRPE
jgi:hypothetical protein